MTELLACPICKANAAVGYACGDYFVHCSDRCASPMCDHPSESTMVCSWNDWAKWYEKDRRAQQENKALTVEELKALDYEPIWIEDLERNNTSCWAIAGVRRSNGMELHDEHCSKHYIDFGAYDLYGKTWLAYRTKPKEEV